MSFNDAPAVSSEDFDGSLRSKETIDLFSIIWGLVARYINEPRGSAARDATLRDLTVLLRPKHDSAFKAKFHALQGERATWDGNGSHVSWEEHQQDSWMGLLGELMDRTGLFGKPDIIYKEGL